MVVEDDTLEVPLPESGPLQSRSANVIAKRHVRPIELHVLRSMIECMYVLQEQLRRWADSETNKECDRLKHQQAVKFHVRFFCAQTLNSAQKMYECLFTGQRYFYVGMHVWR